MTTNRIIVVPTANMAKLVYRAIRKGRTPYNYCAGFLDSSGGIGLSLAVADWVPAGQSYINPHTR